MMAISTDGLLGLAADLLAAGTDVWGPTLRDGRIEYQRLREPRELELGAGLPALPLKRLFLPPSEPLFSWRRTGNDISLIPAPHQSSSVVVLGARPCDAASLEAVDRVMGWDYRDDLWFARREATTIVSIGCTWRDAACFCEDIGLGPDSRRGADLFLVPDGTGFLVEEITEKGRALAESARARLSERSQTLEAAVRPANYPGHHPFDLEAVCDWLGAHFEDESWHELGLRCHGCGVCASVCPACHCFDIVDEPESLLAGTRRRRWDSCQPSAFTVHASGHNPRPEQQTRFRQRVMHKFRVFPERFDSVLCTGCGRCTRACPAGQDLLEILTTIESRATAERESPRT